LSFGLPAGRNTYLRIGKQFEAAIFEI